MARIAFFTESLPPNGDVIGRFAWDLIHTLAEQQHEIRVFSTFREGEELPPSHSRIEILRPFKKWGLLELPRMVPLLMAFRPDVIHLIQPHQEALTGFSNAMELVPSFNSLLGHPPMIASFFDVDIKSLRRHRLLLKSVRALTVSNQTQHDLLNGHFSGKTSPQIAIVPMGFGRAETVATSLLEEIVIDEKPETMAIERLKSRHPNLFVVAGPLDSHVDPLSTFKTVANVLKIDPAASAVLLDGWGRVPIRIRHLCEEILFEEDVAERVLLTGALTESGQLNAIAVGQCVLVAPLIETRLAFTKFLRNAQRANAALVLSVEQARMDPVSWRDEQNAMIRSRSPYDLADAVLQVLKDKTLRNRLKSETAETARTDVSDQPGNLVSRLYVKILNGD